MAARASFSSDSSRIVNNMMPAATALSNSSVLLLKDHLLDDLSSCSSNGFRSYPRRQQCCTKVRYLIQIDLINNNNNNKHIKFPPTSTQNTNKHLFFFKNKYSKSKKLLINISSSSSVLHKASNAVVNAFKKLQFSASRKPYKKAKAKLASSIVPRNLSRNKKLSKHGGLWKQTSDDERDDSKKFERSDEYSIKQKKKKKKKQHISPRAPSKVTVTTADIIKSTSTTMSSNSNSSNSFVSSDHSYFTASKSSSSSTTIGGSNSNIIKHNAAHDVLEEASDEKHTTVTDNAANGNAQKEQSSMEKDQFSPVSVLDFPFDNDDDNNDEDEVTSPFRRSKLYVKGSKQKLIQRTKSLAQIKPVRLEDRISLAESRTNDSISSDQLSLQSKSECELEGYEMEKKAIALLQLLKATMPSHHHLFESTTMTESILLGFFAQRIMEGNVSNYTVLQEAKDWINDQTKDMFETQDYKLAYIRDMEKGAKWFKYDEQVETQDVGLELEYEVFTSLVEEMLHDFYL